MNGNCTEEKSQIPEYNLEFQGSVRNLQKRALFMNFYPEMPWNNITFGKKGTFFQMLQRAASDYRTLISSGLLLECHMHDSFFCCFLPLSRQFRRIYIYILTIFRGNPGIVNFKMTLHNFITRQNFFIHEIKNIWKLIKMSFRKCTFSHNWTPILSIFCLDTPNFW